VNGARNIQIAQVYPWGADQVMRVDGPSYHIEQARWHHRPGTPGTGKPQIGQIASRQAGRNGEQALNHIADLDTPSELGPIQLHALMVPGLLCQCSGTGCAETTGASLLPNQNNS
jgi:hypothetical protein